MLLHDAGDAPAHARVPGGRGTSKTCRLRPRKRSIGTAEMPALVQPAPVRRQGSLSIEIVVSFLPNAIDGEKVMHAKNTTKLSVKFQISIPKSVRVARHWQAGQVFAFIPKGEGLLLVPVPSIEQLSGLARGAAPENYRDRTDRI